MFSFSCLRPVAEIDLDPDLGALLTAAFVFFSNSFFLSACCTSGQDLEIGMDVSVGIVVTPEFIEEHGMTGTWTVALNKYREIFRRRIVAIQSAQDGAGIQGDFD